VLDLFGAPGEIRTNYPLVRREEDTPFRYSN
jgi:hypothetical protein